jgi:hypothetical protein
MPLSKQQPRKRAKEKGKGEKGKGVASQHLIALKNPLFLKMGEDG